MPAIKDSIESQLKQVQLDIDALEIRWDTLDTRGTGFNEQVEIEKQLEELNIKRSELAALL